MALLEGQVAIITGAGTGVGRGIARAFAGEGASVVLASNDEPSLEDTAEELGRSGATVNVIPTDVRGEGQVIALFRRTMEQLGRLDILVNNAAAFDGGPIEELTLESWQHVVDVNLTGVFLCTREAMRTMKRRGRGRIINIGSTSAQIPRPHWAPYSTTKHGVIGLTRATALEGRDFGVVVSCIHPGNVDVGRRSESHADPDREPTMSPDDIGRVVVTVAAMPPNVNMLDTTVLPVDMPFLGRG